MLLVAVLEIIGFNLVNAIDKPLLKHIYESGQSNGNIHNPRREKSTISSYFSSTPKKW